MRVRLSTPAGRGLNQIEPLSSSIQPTKTSNYSVHDQLCIVCQSFCWPPAADRAQRWRQSRRPLRPRWTATSGSLTSSGSRLTNMATRTARRRQRRQGGGRTATRASCGRTPPSRSGWLTWCTPTGTRWGRAGTGRLAAGAAGHLGSDTTLSQCPDGGSDRCRSTQITAWNYCMTHWFINSINSIVFSCWIQLVGLPIASTRRAWL